MTGTRGANVSMLKREALTPGMRESEYVAAFTDHRGKKHFIRDERGFLTEESGASWLPVGVMRVDPKSKLVLLKLPHEAETGTSRLCVGQKQLDQPAESYA